MQSVAPVLPGEVIAGKYRVERIIGEGGMGVVVAAEHVDLGQKVAIKFLIGALGPAAPERFMREARAAATMKSEHICRVQDFGRLPTGVPYIVMEYLDGYDLSEVLRRDGAQRVDAVVGWLVEACAALAEAHAHGIVHRDLKPANLFLASHSDGSTILKVLDFGISKVPDSSAMTSSRIMMGSPLYMSPEQIESSRSVDLRSDIWSLGVVAYELLTGAQPFSADSMIQLAWALRERKQDPMHAIRPDIPPEVESIIDRCLAKRREDRFPDALALAEALAPFGPPDAASTVMRLQRRADRASDPSLTPWSHPHLASSQATAPAVTTPVDASMADAPATPDKPSVAVLPFDNMSGDESQEYLADGVVESLTAALSRIRDFFVIARNSAFTYKGRHINVREIGRDLGVVYIIEGSVQRAGPRVRITVQLIETDSGAHVWAERYDGLIDDIFDLQDRISEQVAGALQPSIRLAEVKRSRRKRPQDLGAYDYTVQAMRHVWTLEKDEAKTALQLLNNALAIDPDYPLALALAAWCHAQHSVYNWVEDVGAARAQALEFGERAAALSSDDPLVLTVLGTVHTFARNYGAALALLRRAVALDPNAAWAWSRIGWLDVYGDRPEEATRHFERALRLSPIDPMNFNNYVGLGSAQQVAGNDAASAECFIRALHERPNAHWIHRNLAPALWGAGREEEARASFAKMIAAYPDLTVERFKRAMVFSPRLLQRIGAQLAELGLREA